MNTDVRHDCRQCFHSNDSHDPLVGCLYPNCVCGIRYPAAFARPGMSRGLKTLVDKINADERRPSHRLAKRRQRPIWRAMRAFLGTLAGLVLALSILAFAFLAAVVFLLARS